MTFAAGPVFVLALPSAGCATQTAHAQRASIDAIRATWKAKAGDPSVLRVSQPAEVSF